MGSVFRRLLARTIAQQINPAVESATAPFQHAFTIRTGVECVSHVIKTLTDVDPEATVLFVDGVGAFDLTSRAPMLEGLQGIEGGNSVPPFLSQFYSSASTYIWEGDFGVTHKIIQGEGGAQGDPLMPALFAVGQHRALVAMKDRLLPHEHLLAFLDDIYIVLERVVIIHTQLRVQLWHHARMQKHQGKTRVWNRARWSLRTSTCCSSQPALWTCVGKQREFPRHKKKVVVFGALYMFEFVHEHLRARGIGQWWICRQRG